LWTSREDAAADPNDGNQQSGLVLFAKAIVHSFSVA
jgi:hypothetical protein